MIDPPDLSPGSSPWDTNRTSRTRSSGGKYESAHFLTTAIKPSVSLITFVTSVVKIMGGTRKWADSYFPPEDRVRLVRLVSHEELPGERSGGLFRTVRIAT